MSSNGAKEYAKKLRRQLDKIERKRHKKTRAEIEHEVWEDHSRSRQGLPCLCKVCRKVDCNCLGRGID